VSAIGSNIYSKREKKKMSTALLEKPGSTAAIAPERQIVALHLGAEIYGVDIACIHTVLTPQPITTVPNVPAYVKGVMNLRGRILPVLDLRTRFGLPPLESDMQKSSRIVIVESEGLTAGLVVDSVSEVLRLPADAIEPPSALLASADLRCLTGIGRVPSGRRKDDGKEDADRLILLLNIPQTLTLAEEAAPSPFSADH
jgi:purine-binding chemotaxis protein CheW